MAAAVAVTGMWDAEDALCGISHEERAMVQANGQGIFYIVACTGSRILGGGAAVHSGKRPRRANSI